MLLKVLLYHNPAIFNPNRLILSLSIVVRTFPTGEGNNTT